MSDNLTVDPGMDEQDVTELLAEASVDDLPRLEQAATHLRPDDLRQLRSFLLVELAERYPRLFDLGEIEGVHTDRHRYLQYDGTSISDDE